MELQAVLPFWRGYLPAVAARGACTGSVHASQHDHLSFAVVACVVVVQLTSQR
jgi:hypothetical protein